MIARSPHPQEHCGHECVCHLYSVQCWHGHHKTDRSEPCSMKGVLIEPCQHDTRSHAAAPVPTGDDTQKTISALISENARLGAELKESNRLVELFSGKHDAEVARAERERVLDIIRRTDAGACPYEQCHSGEGHDGLNCRDCLIKFVEDTPGSGGGKPQQQE